MDEISLEGRTVLLTGASRGIGRAAAILLAKAGASVALHYAANESEAHETQAACRQAAPNRTNSKNGGAGAGSGSAPQFEVFRADLGHSASVRALVDDVRKQMGSIHVLVNNAGISHDNPFDEPDFDRWRNGWQRMLDVNLMSAVHATWCVLPEMKARGEGRVINVASRAAFRGEIGSPDYGAAKAALVNFTRSLAREMGRFGIVSSCIAPGWVETDMARQHFDVNPEKEAAARSEIPLGRLASPEDCAGAILYLAGPLGAYLNGTVIAINGGSFVH